jgi:hypothetical protein
LWDFGNGNQSTLEDPPAQNYPNAGIYTISLQTSIDTIGYFLSGVSVLAATGCNDSPWSAPDYYFVLKQGGTTLYTASYIDNTDPPVSFSFASIPLQNLTYTIEVYDWDSGLAGDDDHCGTISFNGYAAGTQTLTSGTLITTITIEHPVIVIDATDTIEVFPTPQVSSVHLTPNDSICANDSIRLSVVANGPVTFQWYRDTLAVLNALDSVYQAKQSGIYYCEVMNAYGCRSNSNNQTITVIPNPPKPTFWITTNMLNTNLTGFALQWYFEGNPIAGATAMTCAVSASGNYFLTAMNYFGCESFSDTVFVTYNNTGLEEEALINRLEVFPNPSTESFTLRLDLNANTKVALSLYDMQGRKLMDSELGERSGEVIEKIDIRDLKKGIYLFEIRVGATSLHRRVTKL